MRAESLTAQNVEVALKKLATKKRAESSQWFFKTGKGQYGFGDKFLGVNVPDQRKVSKRFQELPLIENKKLLNSEFHECRLTALLILVIQFKNADEQVKGKIVKHYLSNITRVNNWDLVDSSAAQILGEHLYGGDTKLLYKLASSKSLWERRISIISTFAFIKRNEFDDSLALCELLLQDKEDLMHKAVGWTLREIGKKSKAELVSFLKKHAHDMPRTALRYSLEHFDKPERVKYMKQVS
jgi:3-methyladenine DNA glycosylase AlkD